MKKIILLLVVLLISCATPKKCCAQIKDFFKYSTFYTSVTTNTPFTEREDYIAVDKGYDIGLYPAILSSSDVVVLIAPCDRSLFLDLNGKPFILNAIII